MKHTNTQKPTTWRELLGQLITLPQEKQRLAKALGVSSVTLMRWVHGESSPRLQYLRLLPTVFPEQSALLRELLAEEFEELASMSTAIESQEASEIPSAFYTTILHAYTTLPKNMRFWSVCELILQEAVRQLDPDRQGIEITVVRCMPHSPENTVRYLREEIGGGTPPWDEHIGQRALLLGVESLAGFAVTSGREAVIQQIKMGTGWLPAHRTQWEESAAAAPILNVDGVSGCILVSSAQSEYFSSARLKLVKDYANLLILAFHPHEFYPFQQIELGLMPPYTMQQRHFAEFQQRLVAILQEAVRNSQLLTLVEAERIVWQHIAEELLKLPFKPDEKL